MQREKAVIDGCNIVYLDSPQRKPSIENIFAVIAAVRASAREPLVIVEPAALSVLGESALLQKLLSESCVMSVPTGSDVARVVLEKAQECDGIVVSNNTYTDYWSEYPWVELCRLPVAKIEGSACLLEARFKGVDLATLARRGSLHR
jgi:hypothetical protein